MHLSDWPAEPRPGRRHPGRRGRRVPPPRRARPGRPHRGQGQGAPAPAPGPACCTPASSSRDEVDDEIRIELNVKEIERLDTLSERDDLDGRAQLPDPRPPSRSQGERGQGRPGRGRRIGPATAAESPRATSRWRASVSTTDDVEVRAERHGSFALAEEDGWAVALDLEVDDELRGEGQARELVRALNDLRKANGLAISDRIVVSLVVPPELQPALDVHRDWIAAEILATVDRRWRQRRLARGVGGRSTASTCRSGCAGRPPDRFARQRRRPKRPRLVVTSGSSRSRSKKARMAASASSSGGPSGWSSGVNSSVGGPESSSGSAAAPASNSRTWVDSASVRDSWSPSSSRSAGGAGLVGVEPGARHQPTGRRVVEIEAAGVGGVG